MSDVLIDGNIVILGEKRWKLSSRKGMLLALLAFGEWLHTRDLAEMIFGDLTWSYANPTGHVSTLACQLRKDLADTDYRIIAKNGGLALYELDDEVMVG